MTLIFCTPCVGSPHSRTFIHTHESVPYSAVLFSPTNMCGLVLHPSFCFVLVAEDCHDCYEFDFNWVHKNSHHTVNQSHICRADWHIIYLHLQHISLFFAEALEVFHKKHDLFRQIQMNGRGLGLTSTHSLAQNYQNWTGLALRIPGCESIAALHSTIA